MLSKYNKFSKYLRDKFGLRVQRVSVDAGFTCPNRDGTKSTGGCIYCDNRAFIHQSKGEEISPIEVQIEQGMAIARRRFEAKKFFLYFQAYSNTYAPLKVLRRTYTAVRIFDDIVGIAIATRPDCVDENVLDLICEYKNDYDVWIEYGLQSVHDLTLQYINRGHTYDDFLRAYEMTKNKGIKVCVHTIIGLPGETRRMMLETAKKMADLKIDGIKIHPMHIVKNTMLEDIYKQGQYMPLDIEVYVDILAEFLSELWPGTVVQRLGASCSRDILVAPSWVGDQEGLESMLENVMSEKNIIQGSKYIENITMNNTESEHIETEPPKSGEPELTLF
ncbi:MAG: TIGR01212 family radical SAM protein [Elusimicrobiota bacterium]